MVVSLLLLVLVIQPGLAARGAPVSIIILVAAVLAVVVAGLAVLLLSGRLLALYKKWALVRMVASLAGDVRGLFTNPRAGATLAALSLAGHLNTVVTAWIIANALGLGITLADCLVLVPVITLAATLPISLGGWGVREGVAISLFGLVGVSSPSALALSILLGLAAILVALPGSILWSMRERRAKMELANWSADEPA
jgi:glycosyltransferase 2 family protein